MNATSPEHRVRSRLMGFSLLTSVLTFFAIEGYVLQDQLEIGHASAMFMFGTACLIAGVCIGLFALTAAIGLAISAAFSSEHNQQSQGPSAGPGAIIHRGNPRTCTGVKPNAIGRPEKHALADAGVDTGFPSENATTQEEVERFLIQSNRKAL
jgi:hypothetical protein